jgi:site-specific recombinase XerD
VDLYFTKMEGWSLPDGTAVTPEAFRAAGLVDGLPFFLRADGTADEVVNSFFRELAVNTTSRNTWTAYARDMAAFFRFLDEALGMADWRKTTWDHLLSYKSIRRPRELEGEFAITAKSWNRAVGALEVFFDFATESGAIPASPMRYRQRNNPGPSDAPAYVRLSSHRNRLKDAAETKEVRYVSLQDYHFFREVGLRGRMPDGNGSYVEDPGFQGTTSFRNVAVADFIVSTGARIGEASSLLTWEIPPRRAGKQVIIQLADAVCKYRKGRKLFVPGPVFDQLVDYRDTERDVAESRARGDEDRYSGISAPVRAVRGDTQGRYRLVGEGQRTLNNTPISRRKRLLEVSPDGSARPLWLWLAENGSPLSVKSWEEIFATACERCRHFGREIHVTPHMLRHTYAVHMLMAMVSERIRQEQVPVGVNKDVYRRIAADPLRLLSIRLGHASLAPTWVYLDFLDEVRDVADAATEEMGWLVMGQDEQAQAP